MRFDLERVINDINNHPQFETTSINHLPSDANISSSDIIEDTDVTPLHEVELHSKSRVFWMLISMIYHNHPLKVSMCSLHKLRQVLLQVTSKLAVICGRQDGEEGYGSNVWCPRCDIDANREQH